MRFAPKCGILLQDWVGSKLKLFLAGERLGEMDKFS